MTTYNPDNERVKRQYLIYLKEAKHQSEATIDAVAMALARFEADTRYRSFKSFHVEQVIAFKRHLAHHDSEATGNRLSKATMHAMLAHLKRFFQWLAGQNGYKSRIKYSHADYFSLSDKDTRVATARRPKPFPTLEQVRHAINLMPHSTAIELRNRALMGFILLTGARDSAVASLKLKHVDLTTGSVYQDARDVRTKFSKTFTTYFFPVGNDIRQIVVEWVTYLRETCLWGNDDPLFPATRTSLNGSVQFEADGLARSHWRSASAIRAIFRHTFNAAGLQYFNPHSIRSTLGQLAQRVCQTPEEFKAWSQNLGHESVLTTFYSYGEVGIGRQGEIIRSLCRPASAPVNVSERLRELVFDIDRQGTTVQQ